MLRIAIVGGGIGGLAAALSLRAAGFDAHVYEQTAELTAIGAGIQISPNATRLLHRHGLAQALATTGVRPAAGHTRRWDDGRTLQRTPLNPDMEAAFGAPYYHFHRAELLEALCSGLPGSCIHLGHRLTSFVDHGDRVTLAFENGVATDVDVLVGADGIHSRVRELLFGPEHPLFTGCIAYRGLVQVERLAALNLEVVSGNWWGPQGHFVHYFVAGGRLHNFVAVREEAAWTREGWTHCADKEEALSAFAGWHPTILRIITAVDQTYKSGLFDRDPLPRWSLGRVTLLGDACHPMLPFMAQGAVQSIEDGATLAACLREAGSDVPAALQRYEALRRPRATRLQEMSRINKTRFHMPDGDQQRERDAAVAVQGDRSIAAIGWLYAHDASLIPPPAGEVPRIGGGANV